MSSLRPAVRNLGLGRGTAPLLYGLLMVLGAGLGWVKQLVFAKALGPEGMGLYSTFILVYGYGGFLAHLGLRDGMLREASMLRGRGQEDEARVICDQAVGTALLSGLGLLALYLPLVWLLWGDEPQLADPLLWGGVAGLANCLFIFSTVELRIYSRDVPFAAMTALRALATLGLGLVVVHFAGATGLLPLETAVFAALFWLSRRIWLKKASFGLAPLHRIKTLLKVGTPQMLSGFLVFTSLNVERWFVLAALGLDWFGQYSFGMTIAVGGVLFLNIVQAYLGPKLLLTYGRNPDIKLLFRKLVKLALAMAGLGGLGWLSLFVLVPLVGQRWFNAYRPGLEVMFIVAPGVAAQMASWFSWLFYAEGKTYINLLITGFIILAAIGLSAWGYLHHKDIFYFATVYSTCRVMELGLSLGTALFYLSLARAKRHR